MWFWLNGKWLLTAIWWRQLVWLQEGRGRPAAPLPSPWSPPQPQRHPRGSQLNGTRFSSLHTWSVTGHSSSLTEVSQRLAAAALASWMPAPAASKRRKSVPTPVQPGLLHHASWALRCQILLHAYSGHIGGKILNWSNSTWAHVEDFNPSILAKIAKIEIYIWTKILFLFFFVQTRMILPQ